MALRAPLLVAILLAGAALAGCTNEPTDPTPLPPTTTTPVTTTPTTPTPTPATTTPTPTPVTPTPSVDSTTYTLTAMNYPGQVKLNTTFVFHMMVNGSVERTSTHVGAHYADNDTTNPPVVPGRSDCKHMEGESELPGAFNVSCTIKNAGTWYVFPHAQINESGTLLNWWGATPFTVVARDFNVTLSGLPTAPQTSNIEFGVALNSTGTENVTADLVAIEYWNATTATPGATPPAGTCQALTNQGAVGNYAMQCKIEHKTLGTSDYFLRGHIRVTTGGTTLDWYSAEAKVSIVGNPL